MPIPNEEDSPEVLEQKRATAMSIVADQLLPEPDLSEFIAGLEREVHEPELQELLRLCMRLKHILETLSVRAEE
jgi:hypothetical protein